MARSRRARPDRVRIDSFDDFDLDDALDPDDGLDIDPAPYQPPAPARATPTAQPLTWQEHLASVDAAMRMPAAPGARPWPAGREIQYVVEAHTSARARGLTLAVVYRERRRDGTWSKPKPANLDRERVRLLPDLADRRIIALLEGAPDLYSQWYPRYGQAVGRYVLSQATLETLLPLICATGRCWLQLDAAVEDWRPLRWDDGPAWQFSLAVEADAEPRGYAVTGWLQRGEARIDLATPLFLSVGGVLLIDDAFARLDDGGAFAWIAHLREHGPLRVRATQIDDLLARLFRLPRLPRLEVPEALRFEEVAGSPQPRLRIRPGPRDWRASRLLGELSFDYTGTLVPAGEPSLGGFDAQQRRLIKRDAAAEQAAADRLAELGWKPRSFWGREGYQVGLELAPRNLPRVVVQLVRDGWHVEADGKLYRRPGAIQIEVSSGVDWFDLHGTVEFGDRVARLPELLAALRRGDGAVRLDDGTFGILPEEWLRRYGPLAAAGTPEGDHLRFGRAQVGLLDALLSTLPEVRVDAIFERARAELAGFDGIKPADEVAGFTGHLRGYQREGLGWLHFLRRFGFGGCLADDMGLGKTVQVLALLAARRAEGFGPSLVVVPRSLVFNWKDEARRFAPTLSVLDHTGAGRMAPGAHFDDHDLVLTTYGTLRRDAAALKDVTFDYVILDEAQSIKNAATDSAKAARLLRGEHRLALSGTPVQNHLGELWSLFEFLNPGLLGTTGLGRDGLLSRSPDSQTVGLLARGLRPFILRRTKEQVAPELPARTEQTIHCELDATQRALYHELREHYRRTLLGRVDREGLGRAKIQVLEALLRLRQAACHPGLIDRARVGEPSAKLDVLVPQLAEVFEGGHKALVFSQFTSFLAIVKARLDAERLPYEYLDGGTRNRAARVNRFQDDPECRLFLVSLKAGGLGLNLTAAEYVFLLDPWWNPAVEAQAIDRTHRIGQTRPVFAYRLIARDTVEEKVLELQQRKRALADAIITADESLIRTLTREDLELLLSAPDPVGGRSR
jgi:superfamily II DNA or RNA helicase